MDLADVIEIADAYADMGNAIQDQLKDVLDCGIDSAIEEGKLNPNALKYMTQFLELAARNHVVDATDWLEEIHAAASRV